MPTLHQTCPLCGYKGPLTHFEVTLIMNGKRLTELPGEKVLDALKNRQLAYVCRGKCRGMRLSRWRKWRMKRQLKQWSKL